MARSYDIKGLNLEIVNGQNSGQVDWVLTYPVGLYGVILFLNGNAWGDTTTVQVIHPTYGVVAEYGKDCAMPLSTKIDVEADPNEPSDLPEGLTIRLVYNAIDTNGRRITVWVKHKR